VHLKHGEWVGSVLSLDPNIMESDKRGSGHVVRLELSNLMSAEETLLRRSVVHTPPAPNIPVSRKCRLRLRFVTAAVLSLAPLLTNGCTNRPLLLSPESPRIRQRAPELFRARLETSKGSVLLEIHRDWSPHGADRFYNLVRWGFYDESRWFRVIKSRWAQFGINGKPKVSQLWRTRTIPDDPRRESNVRGTIAYAFAVPNGRTTQVFINLQDNAATHDPEGFVPFGRVTAGMEALDALNAEYGESAGGGIRGGKQDPLFEGGNEYLAQKFPRLDFIKRAIVLRASK
jgi:homoserine O-acetyltransferase